MLIFFQLSCLFSTQSTCYPVLIPIFLTHLLVFLMNWLPLFIWLCVGNLLLVCFFPPFSIVFSPSLLYWDLQMCLSFSTVFVRSVFLSCFFQHLDILFSCCLHHSNWELPVPPQYFLALSPKLPIFWLTRDKSQPLFGLVAVVCLRGFFCRSGSHLCIALHSRILVSAQHEMLGRVHSVQQCLLQHWHQVKFCITTRSLDTTCDFLDNSSLWVETLFFNFYSPLHNPWSSWLLL